MASVTHPRGTRRESSACRSKSGKKAASLQACRRTAKRSVPSRCSVAMKSKKTKLALAMKAKKGSKKASAKASQKVSKTLSSVMKSAMKKVNGNSRGRHVVHAMKTVAKTAARRCMIVESTKPTSLAGHQVAIPSSSSTAPSCYPQFELMTLHPGYRIYDVNMYEGDMVAQSMKSYFQCCKDYSSPHANLIVTTSCFSTWKSNKKTNVAGKIIPAVPRSACSNGSGPVRVIFFDDNLNFQNGGASTAQGICNLRHVDSGEYVDFSVGANGFSCDRPYRHTYVHHSSEYRNVLVHANIIDASVNPDYFNSIIAKYSEPGEKLLVFVDVNGTVLWSDTVCKKGAPEVLLSTMFSFVEIRPRDLANPVDFAFESQPAIPINKVEDLRSFVNRLGTSTDTFYEDFWVTTKAEKLLDDLSSIADIGWWQDDSTTDAKRFWVDYRRYMQELENTSDSDGIPDSWTKCYQSLAKSGHTVILNSFGVDCKKVVEHVCSDWKHALQLTINYRLWTEKDVKLWNAQFES